MIICLTLAGYWQELWERVGGAYGLTIGLLGFVGIAVGLIFFWHGLDLYWRDKYSNPTKRDPDYAPGYVTPEGLPEAVYLGTTLDGTQFSAENAFKPPKT